ncbi:MAG: hypothetical protein VW548_06945, partial [Methylotenera sp.]
MTTIKKSVFRHKKKLLKHYQKNLRYTLTHLKTESEQMEEFCWWALSWGTMQLVCDIGTEETAKMFDIWAAQIRKNRFGEFDGTQMPKFEDMFGSLIYE